MPEETANDAGSQPVPVETPSPAGGETAFNALPDQAAYDWGAAVANHPSASMQTRLHEVADMFEAKPPEPVVESPASAVADTPTTATAGEADPYAEPEKLPYHKDPRFQQFLKDRQSLAAQQAEQQQAQAELQRVSEEMRQMQGEYAEWRQQQYQAEFATERESYEAQIREQASIDYADAIEYGTMDDAGIDRIVSGEMRAWDAEKALEARESAITASLEAAQERDEEARHRAILADAKGHVDSAFAAHPELDALSIPVEGLENPYTPRDLTMAIWSLSHATGSNLEASVVSKVVADLFVAAQKSAADKAVSDYLDGKTRANSSLPPALVTSNGGAQSPAVKMPPKAPTFANLANIDFFADINGKGAASRI